MAKKYSSFWEFAPAKTKMRRSGNPSCAPKVAWVPHRRIYPKGGSKEPELPPPEGRENTQVVPPVELGTT